MPAAVSRARSTAVDALDARKAVTAAWNYFRALFPSKAADEISLEEVEPSTDGRHWLVTLSFEEPRRKNPMLPDFLQVPVLKFKVFKVNKLTGKVVSMKMREAG